MLKFLCFDRSLQQYAISRVNVEIIEVINIRGKGQIKLTNIRGKRQSKSLGQILRKEDLERTSVVVVFYLESFLLLFWLLHLPVLWVMRY